MFDFIRTNQMDIMLGISAACLCFGLMLFITKFLERQRKIALIIMEFVATFLLFFDRMAYIYAGDLSTKGYYWVRASNFMVFFLTAGIVLGFNGYLSYLLFTECHVKILPKRLMLVGGASVVEMLIIIMSQFTGIIYYIDEANVYHRGPGFLICYIIPVVCPLIQFTVIYEYRKQFSKWIYISLVLYIFVPIITAIIQIFTYGISIVNMAMCLVSISLYVFTYIDINETVMNAHNNEMKILQQEKKSMKLIFEQTATAFMSAVEARNKYTEGHTLKIARRARRIAQMMGKNEAECDQIYHAALLHNVGLVSIPDNILAKEEALTEDERAVIERVPVLSSEILSQIQEYPYLKEAALFSHEKYDGTGYPSKLAGEAIPEVARIISVVDAYDAMTSKRSYRGALPLQTIREEFIKQAGIKYDPEIAAIVVKLIDLENAENEAEEIIPVETELTCGKYRETVSVGIPIAQELTKVTFDYKDNLKDEKGFSEPAIVLFDAFDGQVHDNAKAIEAYFYLEYGEVWFDGHYISTEARHMQAEFAPNDQVIDDSTYEIVAAKYEDHARLELISQGGKAEVIVALPDSSKSIFIGLTGENCELSNIEIKKLGLKVSEGDIPKIVETESYIDRIESDVPNVQIDRYRSSTTKAVPIKEGLRIKFHTMSLPSSSLVWHCPYIVLFYSDDMRVDSDSYREYAMIKINGEVSADEGIAENNFSLKKKESFPGWDAWKERHKAGLECSVLIVRKGNKVTITTETLGIAIQNVTTILDGTKDLYVTLSGDQVALTDIRIN